MSVSGQTRPLNRATLVMQWGPTQHSPPSRFHLAIFIAGPQSLEGRFFFYETDNPCDKVLDEKRRAIAQKTTLADLAAPTQPWRARGRR